MSTKSTLFLTANNEHWYKEYSENDNGEPAVYIEIDKDSIRFVQYDNTEGLIIGIKGNSYLARILKAAEYHE